MSSTLHSGIVSEKDVPTIPCGLQVIIVKNGFDINSVAIMDRSLGLSKRKQIASINVAIIARGSFPCLVRGQTD